MRYDKLIRDRIPEIITAKDDRCSFHVASDEEYRTKLYEKLIEEAAELTDDPSADEIADILEVLSVIMALEEISEAEVDRARREKFEKRGGFSWRLILEES